MARQLAAALAFSAACLWAGVSLAADVRHVASDPHREGVFVATFGQTMLAAEQSAKAYCESAAAAAPELQDAIGHGLAIAYTAYAGNGDDVGAMSVNEVACTCSRSRLLDAYASGRGVPAVQVCATGGKAPSRTGPDLLRVNAGQHLSAGN